MLGKQSATHDFPKTVETRTMSDPDNEPTRLIRKSSSSTGGSTPTPDPEQTVYDPSTRVSGGEGDDKTRILRPSGSKLEDNSEQTVLVRPSSKGKRDEGAEDPVDGPVVGWLVVLEGPGRGRSVTLGYGMNPIGRDTSNRISLPFGDQSISRHKHATITYEPRAKKYYIQHGESNNLTYLGEEPVLAPALLEGGELIRLGDNTVLKFVPLCGEDFDWEDNA